MIPPARAAEFVVGADGVIRLAYDYQCNGEDYLTPGADNRSQLS
jgi:hypothetical protein